MAVNIIVSFKNAKNGKDEKACLRTVQNCILSHELLGNYVPEYQLYIEGDEAEPYP